MTQPENETLLQRVAKGDAAAVDDCLDQYGDLVWSLARRHCMEREEAEDAVQEIFIDLWRSAARFDPSRGSEVTFICTIARRRLIDRNRYRQRQLRTESLETREGEVRDIHDIKADQVEAQAEAALAVEAMDQLDPKEREVILLSVYQGMSHSQIARHTDLPLGTVKTCIRRGLMRVSDLLTSRAGFREVTS